MRPLPCALALLVLPLATSPALAVKGAATSSRSSAASHTAGSVKSASAPKAPRAPSGGKAIGIKSGVQASPHVPGTPPHPQTAQGISGTTSTPIAQPKPTAAINHQELLSGRHWQQLAPQVGLPPVAQPAPVAAAPGLAATGQHAAAAPVAPAIKPPQFATGDTSGVRAQSPIGGGPRGLIVPGPQSANSSVARPYAPTLHHPLPPIERWVPPPAQVHVVPDRAAPAVAVTPAAPWMPAGPGGPPPAPPGSAAAVIGKGPAIDL